MENCLKCLNITKTSSYFIATLLSVPTVIIFLHKSRYIPLTCSSPVYTEKYSLCFTNKLVDYYHSRVDGL